MRQQIKEKIVNLVSGDQRYIETYATHVPKDKLVAFPERDIHPIDVIVLIDQKLYELATNDDETFFTVVTNNAVAIDALSSMAPHYGVQLDCYLYQDTGHQLIITPDEALQEAFYAHELLEEHRRKLYGIDQDD